MPVPDRSSTEPFYRARITIDRVELHDVPAGFHLMPGMPVTADIKVGKRTVLKYCWVACCRSPRRECASREAPATARDRRSGA